MNVVFCSYFFFQDFSRGVLSIFENCIHYEVLGIHTSWKVIFSNCYFRNRILLHFLLILWIWCFLLIFMWLLHQGDLNLRLCLFLDSLLFDLICIYDMCSILCSSHSINEFLSNLNLGERTIKGCLEAYSCKSKFRI